MAPKLDVLLEAERRGILPENKKVLLEEARKRGLVPARGGTQVVQMGPGGSMNSMSLEDINAWMRENNTKEKAVSMLPAIGATAATLAAPATGGASGLLAASLLAMAGGTGGRLAENLIRENTGMPGGPQTDTESFTDPLVEGAKMGALELAGGPAAAMLRPGAKALAANPSAQKLLQFSKDQNIPFSPSTIAPTKTARFVESMTNLFPTGKAVTSLYQDRLSKWLMDSRSQVISDLTGISTGGTGKRLIAETGAVKEGLAKGSKEAYGEIVPTIGGEGALIPMDQTHAFLRSLYDSGTVGKNKKLKSLIADFESKLTNPDPNLKPNMMKAEDFAQWQAKISGKARSGDNFGLGDKIWAAVGEDMKAFDAAQSKNLSDIVSQAKLDWKTKAAYEHLTNYFNLATGVGPGGQEVFQTGRFYSLIMQDKNKRTLIKDIGEEAYENLKDFAEMALKVSEETGKRSMSDVSKIFQAGMVGGGGYAAFTNPSLLVPYGMAPIVAWQTMKPRGVFKKWLTEGFNPKKTIETLKVGGRAAIAAGNDE